MKKRFIRILKCLSLALAVTLLITTLQTYCFYPVERDSLRTAGFRMEEKDSLDVVLIGASEVYTAYAAPYAYRLYGFTSYSYAVASLPVTLWKTMLEETLSLQSPRLIVVEVNGAVYRKKGSLYKNSAMHYVLDGMPLCSNKINTLDRLVREETDPKACFYLPFIKYHTLWQNAGDVVSNIRNMRALKKRGRTLLKGAATTAFISPVSDGVRNVADDYSAIEPGEEAELYLREFLTYCREKKLNVLFVRFPHRIGRNECYTDFKVTNRVGEIVKEYGFPYENFERKAAEIGIDPEKDFYNSDHLNIYGQKKFTAYFARYLAENCGIAPALHSDAVKACWDESAEYYELFSSFAESLTAEQRGETVSETADTVLLLEEMRTRRHEERKQHDSEHQ